MPSQDIAFQYDADYYCRECTITTVVFVSNTEPGARITRDEAEDLIDAGDAVGLEGDPIYGISGYYPSDWCSDGEDPDMWGERHTLDCASCGTELSYHWHDEDPYCSCGDGCLVDDCASCRDDHEQDEGSYSRNGGCSCDDCRASRDYKPEDEDVLAPPEILAKLLPLVTGIVFTPMTVEPPRHARLPFVPYPGELFTMLGTPGAYMDARQEDRCQCHDCVTRYGEALAVRANSATTPAGAVRMWFTSADNAGWPS